MKYEIYVKIGYLEGRTKFEAYSEYDFVSKFGYLSANLIGDHYENLEEIRVRKVDFLNESNNVRN